MSNVSTTKKSFSQLLDSDAVKNRIQEVLKNKSSQFITSALSLVNSDAKLQECEPASLFNACLVSASLSLPINNNLGFAYIIPYNDKNKGMVAQFQIGYKGFRQLAINSNQYKEIDVKPVYDGQLVEDESFRGFHFEWKNKKSAKVIGYASYFKLLNGFDSIYYMSIQDIEAHAKKYSQTYKKGFGNWKDEFDKMAMKTVVKLHLNSGFAPISTEMQKAIISDQAVINNEETMDVDHVDNSHEVEVMKDFDTLHLELEEEFERTKDLIPADDFDNIKRVIDKKETSAYEKTLSFLKTL